MVSCSVLNVVIMICLNFVGSPPFLAGAGQPVSLLLRFFPQISCRVGWVVLPIMELIGTLGALLSRERGWELGPSQGGLLKNLHKIKIGIKILLIPIQCGMKLSWQLKAAIERQTIANSNDDTNKITSQNSVSKRQSCKWSKSHYSP